MEPYKFVQVEYAAKQVRQGRQTVETKYVRVTPDAAAGASQKGQNVEDGADGDNSGLGIGGGSRTTQYRVERR